MRKTLNSPRHALGIDPGLSGAVALVGRGRIEARRDFRSLAHITTAIQSLARAVPDAYIIEQVGARPGQGVCSMFSFGKSTGVAFGSLYSLPPLAVDEVHPMKWQNWVRRELGMAKKAPFDSREICRALFPEYAPLFKRKKDHNTADAVLLALYALANP
ncbi:MAG: hypothetical protein WCS42_08690 [Verrucomicrobiota bacterium]